MSSTAAVAARVPRSRSAARRTGRGAPAEAVPVWESAEPLTLTDAARLRLLGALGALLAQPGLVGAPDSVRAAAVVLTAKTSSASLDAVVTAGELGRWIGLTGQSVRGGVRPRLQRGVVFSEDVEAEPGPGAGRGRTLGIRWRVEALRAARHEGGLGDPLRLTRSDFVVLLRLVEVLFAPGWVHAGGRVTPPGLLGRRTGGGAATDRLALLLLVLLARPDGSVRLCAGAVQRRYGRAAATVARLLDCKAAGGRAVLERLVAEGVVELPGGWQGRLVIPAVREAYGRLRAARRVQGRPGARFFGPAASDVSAPRDRTAPKASPGRGSSQVTGGQEPARGAESGSDVLTSLHSGHSGVVEHVGVGAGLGGGFSGSAVPGDGRRRDCAHAREDCAGTAPGSGQPRRDAPAGYPLRGEKPDHSLRGTSRTRNRGRAGARPGPAGGRRRGRVPAPPADLAGLLAPVTELWQRLERPGARDRVIRAARTALGEAKNTIGRQGAEAVVAARLQRRLTEQGGAWTVTDPVGWLLGKGLPRRPGACWDPRCDDGMRMDTRGACGACEDRCEGRSELRQRVKAEVADAMPWPRFTAAERHAEVERRMRQLSHEDQAAAAQRLAHAREARREAEAAWEAAAPARAAAQARARAREAEMRARPCGDCGRKHADGLCAVCRCVRSAQTLLTRAAHTAVAGLDGWDGDVPPDGADRAVHAVRERLRAQLDTAVGEIDGQGLEPETAAAAVQMAAETALADETTAALEALAATGQAAAAARMAAEAECRTGFHHGLNGRQIGDLVVQAGEDARAVHAEELLRTRTALLAWALHDERTVQDRLRLARCQGLDGRACDREALVTSSLPLCMNCLQQHTAHQAGTVLPTAPEALVVADRPAGPEPVPCPGWNGTPCGRHTMHGLCLRCCRRAATGAELPEPVHA